MIDLHLHSLYSEDGELSPQALIERCKKAGVSVLSITDHNCVRANDEGALYAKQAGLAYLRGTEIDCIWAGCGFHVLGYGMDDSYPGFSALEAQIEAQSQTVSLLRLEKVRMLGFAVTEEEMRQAAAGQYWTERWTGDLFAEVLLAKSAYADDLRLLPYRPGGARGDNPFVNFYWDFFAEGKPCHVPMQYPTVQEIVALIHAAGGKAVLAHPGQNLRGRETQAEALLVLGFDGIEAFSSYHNAAQTEYFCALAERHGIIATCGSDYHGKTKPSVYLGGYQQTEQARVNEAAIYAWLK